MVKPRPSVGFRTQELTCSSKAKAYIHHTGKGNFPEGQKKVAPHYLSTIGVKLSITYKMAVLAFTGVKPHPEVDPLLCEGSRLTFKMSVQKNAPPNPATIHFVADDKTDTWRSEGAHPRTPKAAGLEPAPTPRGWGPLAHSAFPLPMLALVMPV